ncbi:MAG TPA: YggS family pyridoxal phosphate-dependent enzyme [Planctomicrobium sp.]|nr:YggS family pyridoxal phosphate-dependent enzyme [Planctomicrobium sp.]
MLNAEFLNCLSGNLESVRERIDRAVQRSGRSPDDVELVAVTKYAPWAAVQGLVKLGQRTFGENRPQQLIERSMQLTSERSESSSAWHLIGQLQRNKVRGVLPIASLIHSIDSLRLLERVDQIAAELSRVSKVLLQVNISGEEAKSGFTPDEVHIALQKSQDWQHVEVLGLMTMAPLTNDERTVRNVFAGLRDLRDHTATPSCPLRHLSMGMSGDFEWAIEEGATLVRLGSILFEGCEQFLVPRTKPH